MKSKSIIVLFIGVIVAVIICGTQFTDFSKRIRVTEIHPTTTIQKQQIKPVHKIKHKERISNRLKVFI
jgi:hypothetical protein